MYKLDTLPTASVSSNYQDEDAASDMTKSVNAQIDENTKNLNRHFDHLIKTYNHLHKREENRPKELLALLKHGKKTKDDIADFQEYWGEYYDYANRLVDQKETIDKVKWSHYPNKGDFDKDVRKEIESKQPLLLNRAEANDFAGELQKIGAVEDAHNLYRGPDGAYENEV